MVEEREKKRSGYQKKLEARSKPFIFVGYDKNFTYRIYDSISNKVSISMELHFDETRTINNVKPLEDNYDFLDIGISSYPHVDSVNEDAQEIPAETPQHDMEMSGSGDST